MERLEDLLKQNIELSTICRGQCSYYISNEDHLYCTLAKSGYKINCVNLTRDKKEHNKCYHKK